MSIVDSYRGNIAQGTEIRTYRWAGYGNGVNVMSDPTGDIDRDASHATAWSGAHGDSVIVTLVRSPRGLWMIEGGDGTYTRSLWDKRFRYASDVLDALAKQWGCVFREAVCRCGESGAECDDA